MNFGLRCVAGNEALFRRLLDKFADQHAEDAAKIASALDAGDRELAHRLAHTLKGVGASLGLLLLQEKSTEMDAAFKAGQPPDAIRALLPGQLFDFQTDVRADRVQAVVRPMTAGDLTAVFDRIDADDD